MDKALFQFNGDYYAKKDVTNLSREMCEHLAKIDSDNVTKFDLEHQTFEELLNSDDIIDCYCCYFKVFADNDNYTDKELVYRPLVYNADVNNLSIVSLPRELATFHVFHSKETCKQWLEEHNYGKNVIIERFTPSHLDDYVFIDY